MQSTGMWTLLPEEVKQDNSSPRFSQIRILPGGIETTLSDFSSILVASD